MSYAQRLLENQCYSAPRAPGDARDLELYNPEPVCVTYPKTAFSWTDRTGITTADVTGPLSTTGLVITETAQAGTLVITADGTASRHRLASPSCSGTNAEIPFRSARECSTSAGGQQRRRE